MTEQPTPDATVLATLNEHIWEYPASFCDCGYYVKMPGDHRWHLAAVLEPLIREREAKALEDAAEAWDDRSEDNLHRLSAMALEKYRAGGPSMPAIWLRERAATHREAS